MGRARWRRVSRRCAALVGAPADSSCQAERRNRPTSGPANDPGKTLRGCERGRGARQTRGGGGGCGRGSRLCAMSGRLDSRRNATFVGPVQPSFARARLFKFRLCSTAFRLSAMRSDSRGYGRRRTTTSCIIGGAASARDWGQRSYRFGVFLRQRLSVRNQQTKGLAAISTTMRPNVSENPQRSSSNGIRAWRPESRRPRRSWL